MKASDRRITKPSTTQWEIEMSGIFGGGPSAPVIPPMPKAPEPIDYAAEERKRRAKGRGKRTGGTTLAGEIGTEPTTSAGTVLGG